MRETPAVMIPGPGIRGDQSGDLDTGGSAGLCEHGGVRPELGDEVRRAEQQQERQQRGGRPGASHRQARAAAFAMKPSACSSLRAIRSMVAAAST